MGRSYHEEAYQIFSGNPPCKKLGIEVEFSRYEGALHEAVEIHG